MRLLPRDQDKLLLHHAGFLAQQRLARGLLLNQTEAVALIASQLQERIRDGQSSVAELMQYGKTMLGRRHVLPGVPNLVHQIQVEGTFPDGVFLVTVHDPICTDSGDIAAALYGTFFPVPPDHTFPPIDEALYARENTPGAIVAKKEDIVINKGRKRVKLRVTNTGDRPIQVGSHYHFTETNPYLCFDRVKAYGMRLDIPSGTAVRFEPGDVKTVTLVSIGGKQKITGGNNFAPMVMELARMDDREMKVQEGFAHVPEPGSLDVMEDTVMGRESYISMFGPTMGDRVRLGDTSLWVEVEWDATTYGDEVKFGGGKTIRDGMGQATDLSSKEALDLIITNALVIDWSGIYKVL